MTAGETLYALYLEYVAEWCSSDRRAWVELTEFEQERWEQFAAVV